jgi:molybdopterin synthase catalytic subunit
LLRVGDIALAAAASAAHRREAFAACTDLVDEVKHRLPVWKRQVFADGSEEWVGSA